MTTEIKIGAKTYEVKKGDYIQDNGACMLFVAGDGRCLRREGHTVYDYVNLTKKALSGIKLETLVKKIGVVRYTNVTRYYFE